MTLYQFFRPIIIGAMVLVLIFVGLFFCVKQELRGVFDFSPREEYIPQDGVWYCAELKMQLSFSKQYRSTVIMDDEELKCTWRNDIGSSDIYVVCQEIDNKLHSLGELLFWIEYVSMDEETYVVKDHHTEETYVFIRLD